MYPPHPAPEPHLAESGPSRDMHALYNLVSTSTQNNMQHQMPIPRVCNLTLLTAITNIQVSMNAHI